MEKSYSELHPKDDLKTQDKSACDTIVTSPANGVATPAASNASYGQQTTTAKVPDLSSKAWADSKNTPWSGTPEGRLAIRAFSRGIMGAGAFAMGGILADKWMGYSKFRNNENKLFEPYNSQAGLFEQKNPLQFIAKGIDTFVGKPIQWGVESLTGNKALAERSVLFRPTKYIDSNTGKFGRTLGAETVGVTFDFFCASIGDAFGRDIVDLADPNQKKPWRDDKGNLDITGAGVKALKRAWRYVTYNGGEDWAVALPYVYFMKGQRALINHFSPGFKYDFDRGLNGGMHKVDNQQNVTGSYALEGLMDLQSRFTVYNIGTLMYREAYNHIANSFSGDSSSKDKPQSLYGAPSAEEQAKKGFLEKAGDLGKWALRSAVKGTIYMTPAVPFFWITRTAQSKGSAGFFNPEKGILEYHDARNNRVDTLRVGDLGGKVPQGHEICYGNFDEVKREWRPKGISNGFSNPFDGSFKPLEQSGTLIDQTFNHIGATNNKVVKQVNEVANAIEHKFAGPTDTFLDAIGTKRMETFSNKFANAAISYTPYMYMKAETARMWDDGKMDMSTERMIDGATSLNWGEFKAGVGEVWNSILRRPLADPKREAQAQCRNKKDESAPVDFNQTQAQQNANVASGVSSWRDRVITGKQDDAKVEKPVIDSRPRSYAESEAMKKALVDLKPPTSAIH